MTAALAIRGVGKRYGARAVLDEVTFEVRRGEYFGLIGMNGAGKTTLIKTLLDFRSLDRGDIRIFGKEAREPLSRQDFAYLPERFNPPAFATGQDFLRLMCGLHDVRLVRERAVKLFDELELDIDALHRRVSTYSKGMVQKLGLIACLLTRRALLILDEPMSGLDPKARALMKQRLQTERDRGQTMFFSTHLLQDLENLCDRFAVLHEGQLIFTGTASEYCTAYGAADLESAYLASVGTARSAA